MHIAQAPEYLNECNCSLCNSHGVWWGYFDPGDVVVTGETRVYTRAARRNISSESGNRFRDSEMRPQMIEEPAVELHFCGTCGCTTHWTLLPAFLEKVGENKCGVNMRLFAREDLAGIELRFPDGKGWDGVGQWGFVREAVVL